MSNALQSFLSGKQAGMNLQNQQLNRDIALERQKLASQTSNQDRTLKGAQFMDRSIDHMLKTTNDPTARRQMFFNPQLEAVRQSFGIKIPQNGTDNDFTDDALMQLKTGLGQSMQQMTSGQREFEHLADAGGFTPEQKQQAARVAAGIEAKPLSLTPEQVAERERQKLEAQKGLKAGVVGEIETAKGLAKEEIKKQVKQEKEKITYKVFTAALDGLSQALGATSLTGPLLGRLPAATTSAQIAEGAKAIMLPTLKNIFREAGEGTFTDSDQKALEQLLPRRGQTKEAQIAQIEAIEKIVKAKLNIPEAKEGGQLMIDANGNKAMVYPDGSYEEV
jgi:hypothetical protein